MAERFKSSEHALLLGQSIRKARVSQGYTQKYLARMTGVDHSQISRMERGSTQTISKNLQKICKFLQLNVDESRGSADLTIEERIARLLEEVPTSKALLHRFIDAVEGLSKNPR